MRNVRRTGLILILALATISAGKCSQSKLDRAIAAFDAASLLPPALNLSPEKQRCAAEGFKGIATALTEFKKNPTGSQWQGVTAAVSVFDASQCLTDERLIAVLRVAQRILQSIEPAGVMSADAAPDFSAVKDADLKELERLVGKRK